MARLRAIVVEKVIEGKVIDKKERKQDLHIRKGVTSYANDTFFLTL